MTQSLEDALKQAELYSDDYRYCFVKLPPNAITVAASVVAEVAYPFTALLVDKDEVTLMLEVEDFEQYKKRLLNHELDKTYYRLITFDIVLDSSLVGFMAKISQALAEAKISIMPFAAYSRDHLFVPEQDFEKAIAVLEELKASI